jgi:outer membrane receptor for ferrienterochelin and colicins
MSRRAFRLALLFTAAWSGPVAAQETGDAPPPAGTPAPTVDGARSYTPADFTRFAPRTALDMLRQVPGFTIQGVSQERGLGQASGNVLINGQRISGKSNDAVTELGRIPAGSVLRIDIVDGATLNIAGLSGQVANVLVEAAAASGQFEYRPEFRARNTTPVLTRGNVSLSGKAGAVDYTIGLRNDASQGGADGPTTILNGAGEVIDRRLEFFRSKVDQPRLSGSLKYDGPGSQIGNLNGSVQLYIFDFLELSRRTGPGQVDRTRRFVQTEDEYNYEIGGDYEWALGPGRLKLIGLHRFERSPSVQSSIISFVDGAPATGNRFSQTGDEAETVGRAEYRLKSGPNDWQLSAEAAFNSLDNVSGFFLLQPDGLFQDVPLPGGTAKVTEDRYDAALTYGRTLSPTLSIQASLGGEYSRIEQTGEFGKSRTFYRPKGFVSAAWKPNPGMDVNAKLERKVGQLNFFDFLSSVNLGGGSQNQSNPDLVPPQSWDGEVEFAQDLGRYGSTTVKLFGRLIDDIVDQIPIGATGEAPGNLERATVLGIEARSTLQLEPFGLQGGRLDLRLELQRTRLDDPLTGDSRPISGEQVRFAEAVFRYDLPGTDWAFGSTGSHFKPAKTFRLSQLIYSNEGPVFLNAYVENKDVLGLTMRATVGNLLGAASILDRINYAGRRTDPVSFVEVRRRKIGPIFSFLVSGTF